jgi:hypothetical protein
MHNALPTAASRDSGGTDSPDDACEIRATPRERQEGPGHGRGAQVFLTVGHGEQQRRQRHQRQQRLAEPGVYPDECVVGKGKRGAEVERAVHQRAGQRPAARQRLPQHHHGRHQHGRGEREPQARSPQRVELTVAEPDPDRVPTGQDGNGDEAGERDPRAVDGHERAACPCSPAHGQSSRGPSPGIVGEARLPG